MMLWLWWREPLVYLLRRREPMLLDHLSLEEVSLAFLALRGEVPESDLPESLQKLQAKDWELLSNLLVDLFKEKYLSSLH